MSARTDPSALPIAACENCAAPLQGEFCHQCGQSVHNPIRHAGHAIEEFFEAFWHLDGRVFRTLRDLVSPGRTSIHYLAGHRARYIAPLRLFVILSVLTFFIGKSTLHVDEVDVRFSPDISPITNSRSVEEVRQHRDRMLAELKQAHDAGALLPGVEPAVIAAQVQIEGEAANRIVELTAKPNTPPGAPPSSAAAPAATAPADAAAGGDSDAPGPDADAVPASRGALFSIDSERWDPVANPVKIDRLPAFANAWINGRLVRGQENVERMEGRPELWLQAFLGSVPTALFVLVPVFALMLKLAYLFKRRLYLEHLVVALYSHVFLLLALTAIFLLGALGSWLGPYSTWLARGITLGQLALFLWMPVYLLLMQKRVYRQGWPMTTLKYLVIGTVYVNLLTLVAALVFLASLAQG